MRAEECIEEGVEENVVVGDELSKSVVIKGVPVAFSIDIDGDTMEEKEGLNDREDVEGAVVVCTTDVDIVILALLVTSTVEETTLEVFSMDNIRLSSMNDVIVIASLDDVGDMK